ncbi:MAG: ABC transporter ATP-binding protein [Anaerolineae bacterium]
MENAIQVRELRKKYRETIAVDGISFDVGRGEIFGLLGPNGAGKTTTVECMLGLRQGDSGEVRLLGVPNGASNPAVRARLGVQLQTTGLLPQLNVREQIALFAQLFPQSVSPDQVLDQVGLREKSRTATKDLSGGQRQRLAVALALVNNPELIFLDEPTTGLDPQARRALWEVVRDLGKAGKSVLLTTHYMEEAETLCDRVAIVDHGKIIELDSPQALISKHFKETAIELSLPAGADESWFATIPGVTRVADGRGETAGQVPLTLYSTDVPRTMAGLFDHGSDGVVLKDMTVRQATLEDVFLKLTGRRIRE